MYKDISCIKIVSFWTIVITMLTNKKRCNYLIFLSHDYTSISNLHFSKTDKLQASNEQKI